MVSCLKYPYLTIASQPMLVYNKHMGYTARALLFMGTAPPMKGMLAHDAQAMRSGTRIHFAIEEVTNKQTNAAISRGNKQ